MGVATHDGLALLVAGGALSGCTFQTASAVCAIVLGFVFRAVRGVAGALFFGVALAVRGATNRIGARKLAALAAVFVRVVAYGVVLELAGLCVTALIVATGIFATAVTFFVAFHDSVSAGLSCSQLDVPVVGQTVRLDAIAA